MEPNVTLISTWEEASRFWRSVYDELDAIRKLSVGLAGTEDALEVLRWCHERNENITCVVGAGRPQVSKNGTLDYHMFREKHAVFIFKSEQAMIEFKLTFSDHVFDFWYERKSP